MKSIKSKPSIAFSSLVLLFTASSFGTLAQTLGDYRSNVAGFSTSNWSTLATWQRWNGSAWATPTVGEGYPGQNAVPNLVTIDDTFFVTINLDVSPPNNIGNITINGGLFTTLQTSGNRNLTLNGNLTVTNALDLFTFGGTGNLTVNGATTNNGFFTDSDGTGVSTFVGLVTSSLSWDTSAVTATGNCVFRGGIANTGTFTGGGATFNTNSQSITGSAALSFANNVAITAVTLNNSNTNTLTITGTTTLSTSGGFTDSDNTAATIFVGNVSVGAGTTFTSTAVTTSGNMIFRGGIANNGTAFSAGGATFDTNAQAITGTTATSFANGVVITGILLTYSNTNNLTISGTTTGTGSFTDSADNGIDLFVGNVNLTGAFTSTAVTTIGNMIFRGGITSSGTSFSAGSATFNTNAQSISGTTAVSFANTVTLTNVTVSNTNTASVTMTNTGAGALTGTGGATWTQGVNSTLNYAGSTISAPVTLNASNTGNTVNYNSTSSAQTIFDPSASTYYNLTLSGTGNQTKTLAANTVVSNNLSIQNTAIFSVSNRSLSVAGNWSNSSTNADPFVEGAQTVTFNGTAAQTITNTGDAQGTEFNNLTISNTFGTAPQITIGNAVIVRNAMTMTSGRINLSATTFTIGTAPGSPGSLTHSQASTAGWMYNGSLLRYVNTGTIAALANTGFFPLGDATNFRPFFIQCPTTGITTGGTFTVTHNISTTTSIVSIPDTGPAVTIVRQHQASWTVASAAVAGGTYNLTAGGTGFGTIGALADLRFCKSATVVGTHTTATNTTADPRLQRTGLTLAEITTTGGSSFFVGSSNAASSPLPVELSFFNAQSEQDQVLLSWSTASELNNDFFTVQRSGTGEKFDDLFQIKGKGTTNTQSNYSATDSSPLQGLSYYRLKQTDFDGKFTYSNVVSVQNDFSGVQFSVYPNPSEGKKFNVELNGAPANILVPIRIVNTIGANVFEQTFQTNESGSLKVNIDFSVQAQGLYIVVINSQTGFQRRLIID